MVGFIFIGHLVDWFSLDVEFILSIAAAGSEVGTLGQRSVCGSLLAVEFFFLRFFFFISSIGDFVCFGSISRFHNGFTSRLITKPVIGLTCGPITDLASSSINRLPVSTSLTSVLIMKPIAGLTSH